MTVQLQYDVKKQWKDASRNSRKRSSSPRHEKQQLHHNRLRIYL